MPTTTTATATNLADTCREAADEMLFVSKTLADSCEVEFPGTYESDRVHARLDGYYVEYTWGYYFKNFMDWATS